MGGYGGDVSDLVVLFWVARGAWSGCGCGVGATGSGGGGGWREGYRGNGESRSLVSCSHPELLIFVHVHILCHGWPLDGLFSILVF